MSFSLSLALQQRVFTRQIAIALKELKKRVRGVRELERAVTDPDDSMTEVVQGYCQAVRSAPREKLDKVGQP